MLRRGAGAVANQIQSFLNVPPLECDGLPSLFNTAGAALDGSASDEPPRVLKSGSQCTGTPRRSRKQYSLLNVPPLECDGLPSLFNTAGAAPDGSASDESPCLLKSGSQGVGAIH
jgi:hypothetical protein